MIQGNTLFLGDSMTVALPPAVSVNGQKTSVAQGSKTSTWLKAQLSSKNFEGVQNVFLLIGANDIGWMNPSDTLANIAAIKAMAPNVPNFYVMTVPPFKGWANYASNYAAINARRLKVNEGIRAAYAPYVVPLDNLLADSSDPEKLKASADSGDHLHPIPSATAKAIEATANPSATVPNVPSAPSVINPSSPPAIPVSDIPKTAQPTTQSGNGALAFIAVGALAGALFIARRRM